MGEGVPQFCIFVDRWNSKYWIPPVYTYGTIYIHTYNWSLYFIYYLLGVTSTSPPKFFPKWNSISKQQSLMHTELPSQNQYFHFTTSMNMYLDHIMVIMILWLMPFDTSDFSRCIFFCNQRSSLVPYKLAEVRLRSRWLYKWRQDGKGALTSWYPIKMAHFWFINVLVWILLGSYNQGDKAEECIHHLTSRLMFADPKY